MSYVHPAWAEHQRKRFTRADAYRLAPPGSPKAKPPGWLDPSATRVRLKEAQEDEARARAAAEQEAADAVFAAKRRALQASQDELWRMLAEVKYELAWRRLVRKYSPDQLRVPAGNSDGGQWTGGGDSGPGRNDPRILSDVTPDNEWKPGARYAQDTTQRRYSVNLDEEEVPTGIGHTKRDHVGKTDDELINVLQKDWQRQTGPGIEVTRYRPAQGSFLSRESANDFVNRTLEDNKETVDQVASGQQKDARLEKRFGYVTGKEAFRPNADADPYIRDTYGVRMVIRHDFRSERGYRVYTAFPINEYVTKK